MIRSSNAWFLGRLRVHNTNRISIRLSISARLTPLVTDRDTQTDRPRYVCGNIVRISFDALRCGLERQDETAPWFLAAVEGRSDGLHAQTELRRYLVTLVNLLGAGRVPTGKERPASIPASLRTDRTRLDGSADRCPDAVCLSDVARCTSSARGSLGGHGTADRPTDRPAKTCIGPKPAAN